jgi:molybdopterin converting factor small subunit
VIKINSGMTLSVLKKHITSLFPALKPFYKELTFALNGEIVEKDTTLKDGDEVSLLPPMSGG